MRYFPLTSFLEFTVGPAHFSVWNFRILFCFDSFKKCLPLVWWAQGNAHNLFVSWHSYLVHLLSWFIFPNGMRVDVQQITRSVTFAFEDHCSETLPHFNPFNLLKPCRTQQSSFLHQPQLCGSFPGIAPVFLRDFLLQAASLSRKLSMKICGVRCECTSLIHLWTAN